MDFKLASVSVLLNIVTKFMPLSVSYPLKASENLFYPQRQIRNLPKI